MTRRAPTIPVFALAAFSAACGPEGGTLRMGEKGTVRSAGDALDFSLPGAEGIRFVDRDDFQAVLGGDRLVAARVYGIQIRAPAHAVTAWLRAPGLDDLELGSYEMDPSQLTGTPFQAFSRLAPGDLSQYLTAGGATLALEGRGTVLRPGGQEMEIVLHLLLEIERD